MAFFPGTDTRMHTLARRLAGLARRLCLLAAAVAAPMAAQIVPAARAEGADRLVPFLTLRNATGARAPGEAYGDARSDLKAGWCRVGQADLGLLSPLAPAAPAFIREEFLRVDEVRPLPPAALLDAVQDAAGTAPPLLYVHGYYIGFEKGCRRAALLQENIGLSGRMLWFSWPSDGAMTSYMHDEADLYWSVPDLADAVLELERRFGAGRVDLAGHSMGARGVVLALYEVASRRPDARLGEVVLMAPDMDFAIFERILPRIAPIARKITVYVTADDRLLTLSAQLHGYPRLGEAGNDVSRLAGVEVIDLTGLAEGGPTGHLYHIYSPEVGADLDRLLNGGQRAADREGLVPAGANTWRLGPAGSDARRATGRATP